MQAKALLFSLALGIQVLSGFGQHLLQKEVHYEFEKGGSVSWPEIVSAPNPQIRAQLENRMRTCILSDVSGSLKLPSLNEIKKRASDKVNPLVADALAECESCESQHSVTLTEAYGLVTLACSEGGFCCGAHGYYHLGLNVFEIATGRELGLDDLFAPGYETAFGKLGERFIRQENGIPDDQTLAEYGYDGFTAGVQLAQNWSIDATGISFVFNPYEVSPWAVPPPYFSLGFDEIRDYIRPDGPLASVRSKMADGDVDGDTYHGLIGKKYRIVLHLSGTSQLTGWYYYESQGEHKKILLMGTPGKETVLTETVDGKTTGTFLLRFSPDGMQATGSWKSGKGQLLPVTLTHR